MSQAWLAKKGRVEDEEGEFVIFNVDEVVFTAIIGVNLYAIGALTTGATR